MKTSFDKCVELKGTVSTKKLGAGWMRQICELEGKVYPGPMTRKPKKEKK